MLIVVPLGLTLLPTRTTSTRWWFAFAVPGAVALWLPRGAVSITLASIYLTGTLVLIGLAARHLLQQRTLRPRQVALYTAPACGWSAGTCGGGRGGRTGQQACCWSCPARCLC
ncbi:YndJ family transporter [Kribbella sp. NPDC051936]|uniref:YndJ family transporter n=1 Tax=Kribbella sp. NPDC051936 TaxID=3154946 RepID=UPI003436EBE3